VQSVQTGDQVEEGVGWVCGQKVARRVQLPPHEQLADQEPSREDAAGHETDLRHVRLVTIGGDLGPLQGDAAHDQHAGVGPQQGRSGNLAPVLQAHAHGIGAQEKREQGSDDGKEDAQADLHRRKRCRFRARKLAESPLLQPRLGRDPLPRQPPSGD
jgi:hypothetical protein